MAGGKFVFADQAAFDAQSLQTELPFPVIARSQDTHVVGQRLLRENRAVSMVHARRYPMARIHRQHAAFPRGVAYRLVGLRLDRAEAMHAAHVVDAVHAATPSGERAKPVPIIRNCD